MPKPLDVHSLAKLLEENYGQTVTEAAEEYVQNYRRSQLIKRTLFAVSFIIGFIIAGVTS